MIQHLHSTKSLYAFLALFLMQCTWGICAIRKFCLTLRRCWSIAKIFAQKFPRGKGTYARKKETMHSSFMFFWIYSYFFCICVFFDPCADGRARWHIPTIPKIMPVESFEMPVANFMCNFSTNFGKHGFSKWIIELRQLPLKKKTSATSRIETSEIRDSTLEALPPFLSPLVGANILVKNPGNVPETRCTPFRRQTWEKPCKNYQNAILHIAIFRKETPKYGHLKSQRKNKSQVLGPHSSYCKMLWYQVATIIFTNKNSQCALALLCDLFWPLGDK